MRDLIEVFRMNEISAKTRADLIIKLGVAINHQYASNLTEPVVCELVQLICPDHPVLTTEHYKRYMKPPEASDE